MQVIQINCLKKIVEESNSTYLKFRNAIIKCWTAGSHEMLEISLLAEKLLAAQEWGCYIKLVIFKSREELLWSKNNSQKKEFLTLYLSEKYYLEPLLWGHGHQISRVSGSRSFER